MEKNKILIVDDDMDLRVALKAILEKSNYVIYTAINKIDGWEKLREVKPDLVILDVMMDTHHEGFDMAREIKQGPDFKDLPILMLTSISDVTGVNFQSAVSDPRLVTCRLLHG